MNEAFAARAARYYERKLSQFGPSPKGVDWNGQDSQYLRFDQLLRAFADHRLDLNDYGCGYGALAVYLRERRDDFAYCGYDAAPAMIEAARTTVGTDPRCTFTDRRNEVSRRAFTVASGVFNVRENAGDDAWWDYVKQTLDDMAGLSTVGFAANFLTSYSDADRKRPDLFYPDPSAVLAHCLRTYSRRAVIMHDYPLFEFTVSVFL